MHPTAVRLVSVALGEAWPHLPQAAAYRETVVLVAGWVEQLQAAVAQEHSAVLLESAVPQRQGV